MKHTDPLASASYRWRRIKLWLFYALSVCIITAAVLVGIARLLVPYADELTPHIETWLSAQLDAQVTIDHIEVSWPGLTPSILIQGLSVDEGEAERFGLETAAVEFKLLHLFQRNRVLTQVVLVGPRITLTQQPEGQWQFSFSSDQTDEPRETRSDQWRESSQLLPRWLGLSIRNANLFLAPNESRVIDLHVAEADFTQQGNEYRLSGWLAAAPKAPEQVQFRVWMARQDNRWISAQAWLNAKGLALDYWLKEVGLGALLQIKTVLSAEAWAYWNQDQGGRIDAEWTVAGEHGVVEGQASATRRPIEQDKRAWSVELFQLRFDDVPIAKSIAWSSNTEAQALGVAYADLEVLHLALNPWLSSLAQWPQSMHGKVENWLLSIDQAHRVQHAGGRIESFAIEQDEDGLSLEGIDLDFSQAGDQWAIDFGGSPTVVWPRVFSAQVDLDGIEGRVVVSPDQLSFEALSLEAPYVSAQLDGAIYQTDERLFLDLLINAPRIHAVDPRPFLPRTIIPPPAMDWLQQALVFVQSAQGDVLMHFPVGLQTRDFQAGHFSSNIQFSGIELAYASNWPVAQDVTGRAAFLGAGLSADVTKATVNGMTLAAPQLSIARFAEPTLDLSLRASRVSADRLATALGQLPYPGWSETFSVMQWDGELDASVNITLPFAQMRDWSLAGALDLRGNGLFFPEAGMGVTQLTGLVSITQEGVSADALSARLDNQELSWRIDGRWGPTGELVARTDLAVGEWLKSQAWGEPWADRLLGQTDVSIRVASTPSSSGIQVAIESSLQDTALDLPPPLKKPADDAWPITLRWWGGQSEGGEWQLTWPRLGSAVMRSTDQGWGISVETGGTDQLPIAPIRPGIEWIGQLEVLDLGGWQSLLDAVMATTSSEASGNDWMVTQLGNRVFADVVIDELLAPGLRPGSASLNLQRQSDEWTLNIRGDSIQGEIVAPTPAGRAWVVDLEHLYLLTKAPSSEEAPIRPPNLQDPRQSRPLTLLVESLYWGNLALGSTRVETHRSDRGIEIELLDIDGPDLRLQARGRWDQSNEDFPQTAMVGRLSSRNFNQLIQATGYEAGLRAQQATVDFDLNWPGMPTDFSLIRLEGGLDFELRGGNVPQASAGAGRLLGLVSLSALPRRLILDFRDVFGSGFPYDRITGRFDMVEGRAETEGVKIVAPAAVITLSGSTDMIARTYNQTVVVEPGLGSTLPVIGGLAGGPVGAAAGLVLQSIFNQPIKGVSEVRYSITGPWSEPLIELTDAKVAQAPVKDGSTEREMNQNEDTETPPSP